MFCSIPNAAVYKEKRNFCSEVDMSVFRRHTKNEFDKCFAKGKKNKGKQMGSGVGLEFSKYAIVN